MITPPFEVTQNEDFIFIRMKVKYIKASECDFYVNGQLFKFYCKPYFLRLHLPHNIVEDNRESASYDLEKGELQLKVAKEIPGQNFEHLDMISVLLGIPPPTPSDQSAEIIPEDLTHLKPDQPIGEDAVEMQKEALLKKLIFTGPNAPKSETKPTIELISSIDNEDAMDVEDPASNTEEFSREKLNIFDQLPTRRIRIDENGKIVRQNDEQFEQESDMDFDWSLPQTVPPPFESLDDLSTSNSLPATRYGFSDMYFGFFNVIQSSITDIIDNDDPDVYEERTERRILHENQSFDADHYLADFMDHSMIDSIIEFKPFWMEEYGKMKRLEEETPKPAKLEQEIKRVDELAVQWSDIHVDLLMKIPRKDFSSMNLIDERILLMGLVDLMFSYLYNLRTTECENNVESAWTLVKISSTLSWFDKFTTLRDTLISSVRRSLCFPLFRNWTLAQTLLNDLYVIFYLGKRAILRGLIEMKNICDKDDYKHYLSRLYLEDYILWVQTISSKTIKSLASEISQISQQIAKGDTGFPLEELEQLTTMEMEEEENG